MKVNTIFIILLLPILANAQIGKFDFSPVSETEIMAITWIPEDSIISHGRTLIFPITATNQDIKGCMCMVKADTLKSKAAIICLLADGAKFRELSSQKEKDYILSNREKYAFSNKADDQSVFWWIR